MTSIALIGAGPGLGLAIARTFGSQGFDAALISRDRAELDALVGRLTAEGVTAAAFPADVLAHDALTQALKDAATRFGGIDVLVYAPQATPDPTVPTMQSERDGSPARERTDGLLPGALAATRAVLPAMREAGSGTLIYTTGGGPHRSTAATADARTAATALRDWVSDLREELTGTGIHAAHVALDVTIGDPTFYGQPRVTAEQIAPVYWDLHIDRDRAERIFTG
ncbi:SDR family NAD(P)-dependent oxidoreductase [Streptomyces sp. NPDC002306]